ncbi:5879_t:CDS:2, partial [Racocetra fulgida]
MLPKVSNEYTSIGCNRFPQVAAWGKDGTIAFGAYNYVALYYPEWVNSAILESHGGSVNTLGVTRAKSIIVDKDLIITGSADGVVKVWERSICDDVQDSVKCLQTIDLERKYPMALALSYLPESKNSTIQEPYKLKDGDLLLASASQDKYVRLWRVSYNGEVSSSLDSEEVSNGKSKEKKSLKELLENLPDDTKY